MRPDGLPQRRAGERIIPFADGVAVLLQRLVEGAALREDAAVFFARIAERVDNGLSVAEKIPFQPFAEVEDRNFVVEGGHKRPLRRAVHAEQTLPFAVFAHVCRFAIPQVAVDRRFADKPALFGGEVYIPPIGRAEVARIRKHEVARPREVRGFVPFERQHPARYGGAFAVVAEFLVQHERDGKVRGDLSLRPHFIIRIADGAGERFQIVRQKGRHKADAEREPFAAEGIIGGESAHAHVGLLQRKRAAVPPHKAVRFAVPTHKPAGALALPRPEDRIVSVQHLRLCPHRKQRVDHPERVGR